jgi:hypothetical protein
VKRDMVSHASHKLRSHTHTPQRLPGWVHLPATRFRWERPPRLVQQASPRCPPVPTAPAERALPAVGRAVPPLAATLRFGRSPPLELMRMAGVRQHRLVRVVRARRDTSRSTRGGPSKVSPTPERLCWERLACLHKRHTVPRSHTQISPSYALQTSIFSRDACVGSLPAIPLVWFRVSSSHPGLRRQTGDSVGLGRHAASCGAGGGDRRE